MKINFALYSFVATIVLLSACTKAKDDGSIGSKQDYLNLCSAMDSAYKCSTPVFISLPLGYNSGMIKEEYIEKMKSEKTGVYLGQECEFCGGESTIKAMVEGAFLNDICFQFSHKEDADLTGFIVDLKMMFDSTWQAFYFEYPSTSDRSMINKNLLVLDYYWIKENAMVAYYRPSETYSFLSFYDIPAFAATHDGYRQIVSNLQKHFYPEERKPAVSSNQSKEVVSNSPWDGSVYQVKRYIKKHLKDPSSYESVSWGQVQKKGNNYEVSHVYRAKNSFGAYVTEGGVYTLSKTGQVIKYTPLR